MEIMPVRPCIITPRDTDNLGAPVLSSVIVREIVAPYYAEMKVTGVLESSSQGALNGICSSARFAGTLDTREFEEGLQGAMLNVNCVICKWYKKP